MRRSTLCRRVYGLERLAGFLHQKGAWMHGIVEERRLIVTGRAVVSVELESDFRDCLEHGRGPRGQGRWASLTNRSRGPKRSAAGPIAGLRPATLLSAWPNNR